MLQISETKPIISSSPDNSKSCGKRCSMLAPGHAHNCSSSIVVTNLIFPASLGSIQAEHVASGILNNKMNADCNSKRVTFSLSTGGNLLVITVECPANKVNRRSLKQVSLQAIKELQVSLELSINKTKELIFTLRKELGDKIAVEPNIFGKFNDLEELISHFYHLEKVIYKY